MLPPPNPALVRGSSLKWLGAGREDAPKGSVIGLFGGGERALRAGGEVVRLGGGERARVDSGAVSFHSICVSFLSFFSEAKNERTHVAAFLF